MKRLTRFLPVSLLFVVAMAPSLAMAKGSGRITGIVLNKGGDGLLGAVIAVFREDHQGGSISFTRSDKNGAYALANIVAGTYFVQVNREGYQPVTSSNIKVEAGKTTSMNFVLQEFLDLLSGAPDSRNWDLRTVMRSTSDRRLIFRDLPGASAPTTDPDAPFARGGALSVASNTGLGNGNYSLFPSNGQNGIASNFAFVEPVSYRGRMIFSGQVNTGYDYSWQVRNTYNYRPDPRRDFKLSAAYGRLTLSGPPIGSIGRPGQFFTQDPSTRETGVQTLGFGFEARNKVFDIFGLDYGFDLSRIYYGTTRSFFNPYFQVNFTPADTWELRMALSSRRFSENTSLTLPDGDVLNLMEPTYITGINGDIRLSQFKHAEVALAKILPDDTNVEIAVYEDRMQGPGLPFLVTTATRSSHSASLVQLREDQSRQRGLRVAMNRRIVDFLNGSIAYVYGTGTNMSPTDETLASQALANSLLNFMRRSYYHSLTGQLVATFPHTHTNVTTVVRWYPGYSLTPIDIFADRMDMLTKGVNFSIRQPIPLPEFMGSSGRWVAMVDVRNLFEQGRETYATRDGQLTLARNPRSLRFGINLNLY